MSVLPTHSQMSPGSTNVPQTTTGPLCRDQQAAVGKHFFSAIKVAVSENFTEEKTVTVLLTIKLSLHGSLSKSALNYEPMLFPKTPFFWAQ